MSSFEKLKKAMVLMNEARQLISEARTENESLNDYAGYSLELIEQKLAGMAANDTGYNLEEIIEVVNISWLEV